MSAQRKSSAASFRVHIFVVRIASDATFQTQSRAFCLIRNWNRVMEPLEMPKFQKCLRRKINLS